MNIIQAGLSVFAAALIATTPVAAENGNKSKGYFTATQSMGLQAGVNAAMSYPTNITVMNASPYTIFMVVPNTPIDEVIAPNGDRRYIRRYDAVLNTTVVLLNANRQVFFNHIVCPQAVITVFGNYASTIDSVYC